MAEKVSEYKVWTSLAARNDLRLATGDIQEAINDYQKLTGHPPSLICLNPRNERLSSEVPEGIEVLYQSYLHLWEIWFAWDGIREPHHSASRQQNGGQKPVLVELCTPEDVTHKILELAAQNLSYRAIASNLLQYGVDISHMTVARRIKG